MSVDDIKKLLDSGKLVFGTNLTLKFLKEGKVAKVYIAKNVPERVSEDLEYYNELTDFELIKLEVYNKELGYLCRKPFSVAVIGVLN